MLARGALRVNDLDILPRSDIRNAMAVVTDEPGHCARCGEPFADGVTLFMFTFRRRVLVYEEPAYQSVALPVCERCLTPNEIEARQPDPDSALVPIQPVGVCPGCDHPLMAYADWRGSYCSNRCMQRARRKRRQASRPSITCAVCTKQFRPTRADSRFCGTVCRQWAYRRRHQKLPA